jgi:hypothetical protein
MNSLFSPKNEDAELSPITVGSLALFFTLAIMALVYLSDYSLGNDFADRTPHFTSEVVAASHP